MQRTCLRIAVAAASILLPVAAQTGNELVFVGSSTGGNNDQHAFVESATGIITQQGGSPFTDNVSGAVWANDGRQLYCSQVLRSRVSVADWDKTTGSWVFSTFHQFPNSPAATPPISSWCHGVQFDRIRNRVWTLTGPSGTTRELVCLDGDLGSPTYGSIIAQTTSFAGTLHERWCLSYTGSLACVPGVTPGATAFTLVDLDPSSPSYLSVIASSWIAAQGVGFALINDCKISIDEQYAYVLYGGSAASGLAVWDIPAGTWLDFTTAPGQRNLVFPLGIAKGMDLSLDRSFAVICGIGGAGWAARVDFDYVTPSNSTVTQYGGLTVPDADGISLSPDNTRAAVASTATFLSPPSELTIFDAATGSVLNSIPLLSMWNVYTTAWQDASPVASYSEFGQGCSGSLGTPTIAAAANSRPALGSTFVVDVNNLPFGIAVMASGLSNLVTSGAGLPLPFDLSIVGMPGCSQLVDALILDLVSAPGSTATWSWPIPNNASIFGYEFFNQAFALDLAANAFGFTASNAGVGTLGY